MKSDKTNDTTNDTEAPVEHAIDISSFFESRTAFMLGRISVLLQHACDLEGHAADMRRFAQEIARGLGHRSAEEALRLSRALYVHDSNKTLKR